METKIRQNFQSATITNQPLSAKSVTDPFLEIVLFPDQETPSPNRGMSAFDFGDKFHRSDMMAKDMEPSAVHRL